MATAVGLVLLASAMVAACGGGGKTDSTGRNAPTYAVGGTIAGLDEGFLVLSNGLDVQTFNANPDGLAVDAPFRLDTPLPAGSGYEVRIVNDPLGQFALQCDVIDGAGQMPSGPVGKVLVRCARVKSVRLLAGQIPAESNSQDGLSTRARFSNPGGVVVDAKDNIYVADTFNHTIRRITPSGVVSTVAGSAGLAGFSDGLGADARFNEPGDMALDINGDLIVADTRNHSIRRVRPDGHVSTVAGRGSEPPGSGGDSTANARFSFPSGVAAGPDGMVYVADTGNHQIRRITPAGAVSVWAGSTAGHLDATGSAAQFRSPTGLAVTPDGALWVSDTGNLVVRRISPLQQVSTVAGRVGVGGAVDATGTEASFRAPRGLTLARDGNVFVADSLNHSIRRVTPLGAVSTVAGRSGVDGIADGPISQARFNTPRGVALRSDGSLIVADFNNSLVRSVVTGGLGLVTTLAGNNPQGIRLGCGNVCLEPLSQPDGLALDSGGNVYVADAGSATIRRISPTGELSTLAGGFNQPGHTDGSGVAARFNNPSGMAIDAQGNLLVADTGNHVIRKVTLAGVVTTLAGDPALTVARFQDGAAALARFSSPRGVAVGAGGKVYVADTGNNVIRQIGADGLVSTLAGNALLPAASTDGSGAAARFNQPHGLVADANGDLLVSEAESHVLRRVTQGGLATTAAGSPGLTDPWPSDGPGVDARFNRPAGLAFDAAGNAYVADSEHRAIRVLTPSGASQYTVSTAAGGPESLLTRLGPLPQAIGQPRSLALTSKRLYFTSGDAVLFIDR